MRLNNGKGIITDQDIVLTNKEIGTTLNDKLVSQDSKIAKLESNVKWMYKYGALGSGGGNGSGTKVKQSFIAISEDGRQLTNGMTISKYAKGKGLTMDFTIKVYGGGTDAFQISFVYGASTITKLKQNVSADNAFTYTFHNVPLNENGQLTISVLNLSTQTPINSGANQTITVNYIVDPYRFNYYFVNGDNPVDFSKVYGKYEPLNNSIFMTSTAKAGGIMGCIDYSIAVDFTNLTISYKPWFGPDITITGDNLKKHGYDIIKGKPGRIYVPLIFELDKSTGEFIKEDNLYGYKYIETIPYLKNPENAKYVQTSVDISANFAGSVEAEHVPDLQSYQDNLVPDILYLKVTTAGGVLYDSAENANQASSDETKGEKFAPGSLVFSCTPFMGTLDNTRQYRLTSTIYNVTKDESTGKFDISNVPLISQTISPQDQTQTNLLITESNAGIKYVSFTLELLNSMIPIEPLRVGYFINIRSFTTAFNWPYTKGNYRYNMSVDNEEVHSNFIVYESWYKADNT